MNEPCVSNSPSPAGEVAPYQYEMCGLRLVSDLALPELRELSESGALHVHADQPLRVRLVRCESLPEAFEIDGVPNFRRMEDGSPGSEFVAEEVARIVTNGHGTEIVVEHLIGADPRTLSHLVVDQGVARALTERGAMVLHATCVSTDAGAFGFLGSTGTGKSTLAMSFVEDGAQLVADDCLVLRADEDLVFAVPSYGSSRLRDDSLRALHLESRGTPASPGKQRVCTVARKLPVNMDALFVLERNDEVDTPTAQRLTGSAALWAIALHSFSSNGVSAESALSMLMLLRPVVERVPIFKLSYASGFDSLDRVRHEVRRVAQRADG